MIRFDISKWPPNVDNNGLHPLSCAIKDAHDLLTIKSTAASETFTTTRSNYSDGSDSSNAVYKSYNHEDEGVYPAATPHVYRYSTGPAG